MGSKTGIEWADATWNIATGCNRVLLCSNCGDQLYLPLEKFCPNCKMDIKNFKPKIDPACENCYMYPQVEWLHQMHPKGKYKDKAKFQFHRKDLTWRDLRQKKGQVIFVNSLSDVFHEFMSLDDLKSMFKVMNENQQHTFLILTKRTKRMLEFQDEVEWTPNIWQGVSIGHSDQLFRLKDLYMSKAEITFVSAEPLKEYIDFTHHYSHVDPKKFWMITGGESPQPNFTPLDLDWIRKMRDDAYVWGVPFFYKQKGGTNTKCKCCGAKGCRVLDGVIYSGRPNKKNERTVGITKYL